MKRLLTAALAVCMLAGVAPPPAFAVNDSLAKVRADMAAAAAAQAKRDAGQDAVTAALDTRVRALEGAVQALKTSAAAQAPPATTSTASASAPTTSGDLAALVAKAKAGDVIRLAPGVYSASLSGLSFSPAVTITSADPANRAVLRGLTLQNVSGLRLDQLDGVDTTANPAADAFYASGCSNIAWTGARFTNPAGGQRNGLVFRNCTDVQVKASSFDGLSNGVLPQGGARFLIEANKFTRIRADGIHVAATSDLTIRANYFTEFAPTGEAHPDAIQIYNETDQAPPSNVTITANLYVRGAGGQVQGVSTQMPNDGPWAYNMTFTDNLFIDTWVVGFNSSHWNGLLVARNKAFSFAQVPVNWVSFWINNVAGQAVVQDNTANVFLQGYGNPGDVTPGLQMINNTALNYIDQARAAAEIAAFRAAHPEVPN